MPEDITSRTALMGVLVLLIPVLVGVVKSVGLDTRWAPVVALALGLVGAFAAVVAFPVPPQSPVVTVVYGLVMGLTSVGLFSGGRATLFQK